MEYAMKMRWNPLLSSMLALSGAAAILAGCGKDEPASPPAPKVESNAPPPVAAVDPPDAAVPQEQAADETDETVDDATLTTRVKTALLADPETQALEINVDSQEGVVQLSGFADS
jgi:hyperosmotically inducible periplasmic protein